VRLVREMRYVQLKKAALLALQQSEQQQGQLSEQQQQEQQDEVQKLSLEEVQAQLLDARWSTEQLTMARDTAQRAAIGISNAKKESKKQRQQQQQQQQVQGLEQQGRQGHGQQEQEEVARSIAASAPAQAVVPASRQPRRQCTLVRQSCYVDSDDSGTSSPSDNDEL